jgi:DNA-binding NarL/FixJ family response regulator
MGLGNKEIAGELSLSLLTVKNHMHKILKKLQVRNRREAVRYFNETELTES